MSTASDSSSAWDLFPSRLPQSPNSRINGWYRPVEEDSTIDHVPDRQKEQRRSEDDFVGTKEEEREPDACIGSHVDQSGYDANSDWYLRFHSSTFIAEGALGDATLPEIQVLSEAGQCRHRLKRELKLSQELIRLIPHALCIGMIMALVLRLVEWGPLMNLIY